MAFTDPKIADMICELENNPHIATLTYPSGLFEYFDSNKELEDKIATNGVFDQLDATRAIISKRFIGLTLKIYEHADLGGQVITLNGPYLCPNMRNVYNVGIPSMLTDFNDIISSFELTGRVQAVADYPLPAGQRGAIVTFFEDFNYEYGNASFVINVDNPKISHNNFKKVKRCPSCSRNMNDRTSSIKLQYLP